MAKTYKGIVYKIYDDGCSGVEWYDIVGEKQIREFALDQLGDKGEDFVEDYKAGYDYLDLGKKIENLLNKGVLKPDYNVMDLSIEEVSLIFKAFDFNFDELYIE